MHAGKFIWDIMAAGRERNADAEVLRQILVLNALMIPGIFFTFFFGIMAFLKGNFVLASIDIFFFLLQLWLFGYARKSDNLDPPVTFAIVSLMAFFVFLTANGGDKNSAILWVLLYPYVSILLTGSRRGILYSSILFVCVFLVFALQGTGFFTGEYSRAFQIRFLGVYFTIALLSISAEELHQRIYRNLKRSNSAKEAAIVKLNGSLEEIKTLQGILPICFNCKKIRDDEGYWQALEEYVQHRTEAKFSHALCPECAGELYPEFTDS